MYVSRTGTDAKYQKIEMDGIIQLGEELYNGDLERRDDIDAFGRPAAEWKYSARRSACTLMTAT